MCSTLLNQGIIIIINIFIAKIHSQTDCFCNLNGEELYCNGNNTEFNTTCKTTGALNEIKYLTITHSPITVLSDILKGNKSLVGLTLSDVQLLEDWNWGPLFEQLDILTQFYLEDSSLPGNVFTLTSNKRVDCNLRSFSVINCKLQSIDTNIMNEWFDIRMISLSRNSLTDLRRSWFSSTLQSLWSLDLSYNNIETISDDFFNGMTSLTKLRLDNNQLKTLKYECFQRVWPLLNEFWIDDNQIACDTNLRWIPHVSHPTFFDDGHCISIVNESEHRLFWQLNINDGDIDPAYIIKFNESENNINPDIYLARN